MVRIVISSPYQSPFLNSLVFDLTASDSIFSKVFDYGDCQILSREHRFITMFSNSADFQHSFGKNLIRKK